MEDNIPRLCGYSSFFLILTIHSLLVHGARSEVYTVGDDEGWDTGVDYGVWSQKHNFSVGDVLGQCSVAVDSISIVYLFSPPCSDFRPLRYRLYT